MKDICNELEVRSLCHKILQNVSTLLHADRGSLFLVQGEKGGGCTPLPPGQTPRGRCLVSKLFDVCSRSTLTEMEKKEEIRIPWGTGIVGYVAESGEPVNIPDAYQVRRKSLRGCACACTVSRWKIAAVYFFERRVERNVSLTLARLVWVSANVVLCVNCVFSFSTE